MARDRLNELAKSDSQRTINVADGSSYSFADYTDYRATQGAYGGASGEQIDVEMDSVDGEWDGDGDGEGRLESQVAQVGRLMTSLRGKLGLLKGAHKALLGAVSSEDSATQRNRINGLESELGAGLSLLKTRVHAIGPESRQGQGRESSSEKSQTQVMKAQQAVLAAQAQRLIRDYQNLQADLQRRVHVKLQRQVRIVAPSASPAEIEALLAHGPDAVFASALIPPNDIAGVRDGLRDMNRVEASIEHLAALMADMGLLLDVQGEKLGDIEANVDSTTVGLESASKEMTKAIAYRRSARKRAWCIAVLVLILLAIAGVLIYIYAVKPSLKDSPKPAPAPVPSSAAPPP